MPFMRRDPDQILEEITREERHEARGKLKIFLGANAGVGKTFAMLSEAHEQKNRGVDVVVGYAETHGRKETDALLHGLETLPQKNLEYKGVTLKEFDIDAALARKPQLLLVDELAHTNAPGSRHPKRYMDVEELLRSGIDVYTTVNIQHIESLNDVVAQITSISVRETIPDDVFTGADEVELVDIPPKDLIQRLKEGKVYMPQQAGRAIENFFREGNLIALRELALRKTADRVDAQMQRYREDLGVDKLWPTKERILVCIAPNRMATRLVRTAKRMADSMHGDVIALFVESDRQVNRSPEERDKAMRALQLAESLNIETVNLAAHDIVGEVMRFAKRRNVTQIVVGKPIKAKWRELLTGSVVDELVRRSGDINVHVITGEHADTAAQSRLKSGAPTDSAALGATVGICALATGLCYLLHRYLHLQLSNLIMVYLLAVAFVSSRYTVREAFVASLVSVAAFDFFFVPPLYRFSVSDTEYLITFGVMLGVALLISSLTQGMRLHAQDVSNRERRTAALFALSRRLSKSRTKVEIANATCDSVLDVFDCQVAVLLPNENDQLIVTSDSANSFEVEVPVASWAFKHGEWAGIGTETLPASAGLYIPIMSTRGSVGILAVQPLDGGKGPDAQQSDLLVAFANQAGIAIERALLAKESHEARLQVETERLRNSLLNSVSHDLRTPLTSIAGAASVLANENPSEPKRRELAQTIFEESDRLNRLVRNLLDMTRLESGEVKLNLEWHSIEELVGSAVSRTKSLYKDRSLSLQVQPDLPLVRVDGLLIEQVLINLLENAARHTPPGSETTVCANIAGGFLRVEVSDNGPGLQLGDEERVFEKFYRSESQMAAPGFGLGLAIARSILKAHGAQIWAKPQPGKGVTFVFELKVEKSPAVPVEA